MDLIEGEFICRKCQTPLGIFKIIVSKKGIAKFAVRCQKGHKGIREFHMTRQNEWMPVVIKHLYVCTRCGANLTDVRQKSQGDKTYLILNCPTHGKVKKIVSTSFWYAMDALRKQLSARPAYPSAYPSPYPQQYPPGSYPPQYQQPGFQQPPSTPPYGAPQQPNAYPTAFTAPPDTISPHQLGTAPPTQPTAPSTQSSTPPSGESMDVGDICPACGETISPGAKFCTNCGTELE